MMYLLKYELFGINGLVTGRFYLISLMASTQGNNNYPHSYPRSDTAEYELNLC